MLRAALPLAWILCAPALGACASDATPCMRADSPANPTAPESPYAAMAPSPTSSAAVAAPPASSMPGMTHDMGGMPGMDRSPPGH